MLKRFHDIRLNMLTRVGRAIMPDGYWHNDEDGEEASCHLTFDDGPHPHTTPELLKLLEAEHIKATFFLTGTNSRRYPELVKRIAEAGHELGNHSFNHLPAPLLTCSKMEQEIDQTNRVIEEVCGQTPRLFRPPYGIMDRKGSDCLKEREMLCIYWGALAEDWDPIGHHEIVRRIEHQSRNGSLIVLHESARHPEQSIRSARGVIEKLKRKGLSFDTILKPKKATRDEGAAPPYS